jgi:predicted RNase H-like HicB family nuclease
MGGEPSVRHYRAVIQRCDGWWIGWLIDLPGVNAQERSRARLIESLTIGAREILDLPPDVPEGASI